jgi:hypothetical protein
VTVARIVVRDIGSGQPAEKRNITVGNAVDVFVEDNSERYGGPARRKLYKPVQMVVTLLGS